MVVNPQFVSEWPLVQHANEVACTRKYRVGLRLRRRLKNDDACRVFGRETQHVCKFMVQCYQRAFLARAGCVLPTIAKCDIIQSCD